MEINDRLREELLLNPYLTYRLKIDKSFNTVFDLSYTLIDIQALILGFIKTVEDSRFELGYEMIASRDVHKPDIVIERILETIDRELDNIDKGEIETFKKEIVDVYNDYQPLKLEKKESQTYRTTHRNFLNKYKDNIKLESIASGSLILEIASGVLCGLIIEFLKRVIDKNSKNIESPIQIHTKSNFCIINIQGDHQLINKNEFKKISAIVDNKKLINIEDYISDTISKVEIVPNNIEKSVNNLLQTLTKERIINESTLYNKKGIKTIVNDINRIKGNTFDYFT